jgi:protein SCO1
MRGNGLNPRLLLSLLVLVVAAGVVALLTVGGSSGSKGTASTGTSTSSASAKHVAYKAEAELSPPSPAPAIKLRNYLGEEVDLSQYKGKALLVTFLYTNCPDVCPLIASNLRVAQNLMGPKTAAKAQIIAVSVDPKGDTPKAVASFLKHHEMTGRMQYLVGDAHELAKVWQAWGVGSERDAEQPQFINHSGLIYGVTASGKRTTVYSASFRPATIAHDVPLLAAN